MEERHKSTFKPRELAAIQMLGHGLTQEQVGTELGMNAKTIGKWVSNPEFAKLVDEAQREFYQLKVRNLDEQMNSLEIRAVEVLREMLDDSKSDNTKLKAVQLILNHQNSRKTSGEGQVLVNFNMPEPGIPSAELIEDGDTTDKD